MTNQAKRLKTPTKLKTQRAAASVNKETATLSRIFTLAMEEDLLDKSPMRFVKKLAEPPPRHRLLTDIQKQAIWRELEKDTYLMRFVILATNLPLRKGQILAITPDAIDFDRHILSAIASKGRPPRPVPLNATAEAVLLAMTEEESFFEVQRFEKRWKDVLIAAGINKQNGTRNENYHLHDLRLWFGSELLRLNTNPYLIKELFNHSSMQISSIYLKPSENDLLDVVRQLDPVENTTIH